MRRSFEQTFIASLIILFAFSYVSLSVNAQTDDSSVLDRDKTLAPFFYVQSDDPTIDPFPLKKTGVEISIAGVMAKVQVIQEYQNEGTRPIEAIYVFPASTRAAVFAMSMRIGERLIQAEIREREQAQQEYEEAKEEGKSASLLEQQRPNVFQMNVANIMPGDTIQVKLSYVELLVPEDGAYEFVYPTVVGPRYSETPSEGASDSDEWVESPYFHEGEDSPFQYNIVTTLSSGIPIKSVTSPSHDIHVENLTPNEAIITLNDTAYAGTKDYILRYNLQGDAIESGVLFYPGDEENFFLLMVEPPARVDSDMIPPREYTFVLDVSGSMGGFPIETEKAAMRSLLGELRESDYFNVITFAGMSEVFYPNAISATQSNIDAAIARLSNLQGGGGTRLLDGLNLLFSLPRLEENLARTILVLTDGYVDFEVQAFDLIRQNLNQANLFAGGIGSSPNRYLIEGMAHCGMGEALMITEPDEIENSVNKFTQYIRDPVLSQIKVQFSDMEVYDVEPLTVPDLFAQRPIIVFGKYNGIPQGEAIVSGYTSEGKYEKRISLSPNMESDTNEALRYLWARHRIQLLADYNNLYSSPERVAEVTELGLTYNLLTEYTSFIAVDYIIRNEDGEIETVEQPLPLPEGVPDTALPGDGSVPVLDWKMYDSDGDGSIDKTAAIGLYAKCMVKRIVDGCTLIVVLNGKEVNVRLIDIDVNEDNDGETVAFLRELIEGKPIYIEIVRKDAGQNCVFVYGFVDGDNINVLLIERGWARYAADSTESRYRQEFIEAQNKAVEFKRGIWNEK